MAGGHWSSPQRRREIRLLKVFRERSEGLHNCAWGWSKVMPEKVVTIYLEAPYTQPFQICYLYLHPHTCYSCPYHYNPWIFLWVLALSSLFQHLILFQRLLLSLESTSFPVNGAGGMFCWPWGHLNNLSLNLWLQGDLKSLFSFLLWNKAPDKQDWKLTLSQLILSQMLSRITSKNELSWDGSTSKPLLTPCFQNDTCGHQGYSFNAPNIGLLFLWTTLFLWCVLGCEGV